MIDGKKKSYTLYQLKEIERRLNPTLVRSYQTSKSSEDEEEEVSSGVDNARLVCGRKWGLDESRRHRLRPATLLRYVSDDFVLYSQDCTYVLAHGLAHVCSTIRCLRSPHILS